MFPTSRACALSACLHLTLLASITSSLPAVPLNAPSLSDMQDLPSIERPQDSSLSLPTQDTFLIPKTNLTLRFHHFGSLLESTDYVSFLREASNDIQHRIDQSSTNPPSYKHQYSYKSKSGFILEICSRSVSSDPYVSVGELQTIVNGLLLYMMQETRHQGVRFQVIQDQDATTAVVMNTGLMRQDMGSSYLKAKREVSPLHLIQYNSTSMSGSANLSTPNLLTAGNSDDFPIPDTHLSLRFGNTGSYLYPGDIETLLIAVHSEIETQLITHGRIARLPSAEYTKKLVGLELWIQAMPWDKDNLAWAELAIIIEGLWLYFVGGKHDRETFIDTINHDLGRQIAFGWIGKPHKPLGHSPKIAK